MTDAVIEHPALKRALALKRAKLTRRLGEARRKAFSPPSNELLARIQKLERARPDLAMLAELREALAVAVAEQKHDLDELRREVRGAPPAQPPRGFVTRKRASFLTGYSVETVRRHAHNGQIGSKRVGGKIYVDLWSSPHGRTGVT